MRLDGFRIDFQRLDKNLNGFIRLLIE